MLVTRTAKENKESVKSKTKLCLKDVRIKESGKGRRRREKGEERREKGEERWVVSQG